VTITSLPDEWRTAPADAKRRIYLALAAAIPVDWDWAGSRPSQVRPAGDWDTWLVNAGRGFGKTRTGAEWVNRKARYMPGSRGALVAPIAADTRDVMIEGESGILTTSPNDFRPKYEPSKRRLTWPNGSMAFTYSADEPDRLRGPQHHWAWVDEWAAMRQGESLMAMLDLGLRLGEHPEKVVTTTPRPLKWLRALMSEPDTVVTAGSTYDNLENLAPTFRRRIVARYEGTRLGRQELHAEILDDVEGALWSLIIIDAGRRPTPPPDNVVRRVVAIDPATTNTDESDETGIIVACRDTNGHGYVEEDRSGRYSPDGWAREAVAAFDETQADAVVIETNQGGDMCETTLRSVRQNLPIRRVVASRGKRTRAEPISAMYEQGRIHHPLAPLLELEDQMTSWTPDAPKSPDRMDAAVWALTDLMEAGGAEAFIRSLGQGCPKCGFPNVMSAQRCSHCGEALRVA